jgi:hypothetical protein
MSRGNGCNPVTAVLLHMKVTKTVPWSTMMVPLPLNRFTTGTPSRKTGCIATSSKTFLLAQKPHGQPNSPRHAHTNEGKLLTAAPRAYHSGGWHGDKEGLRWWFPSPAGCREELLDPTDLGTAAAACSMFRGKVFLSLRVFPMKGIYRRKGDAREWIKGPHHLVARPGGGPRHPMVRPPPGPAPSLL